MRFHLVGLTALALVAITAVPAAAQPREESLGRRLDRIEGQLRAVQRRVFPGGAGAVVEPEIRPANPAFPGGVASGDALANLTARVDGLEAQLRSLTGQIEESGFRTRQLEEQIGRLRTELAGRLDRLEQSATAAAPTQQAPAAAAAAEPPAEDPQAAPAEARAEPALPTAPAAAVTVDAAEEAYNRGFQLWDGGQYQQAQQALEAAAAEHPRSRWTSWMRNLHGRALLDDGKPASAARIFLSNYEDNPRGERAADSLFFLGEALTRLDRRAESCRVYDELEQVYPNMRSWLRERLPAARTAARCDATAARE